MASSSSNVRSIKAVSSTDQLEREGPVWVETKCDCPHIASLTLISKLPPLDSLCVQCKDGSENWICLVCGVVGCGRYVGGHMLAHSQESGHPVAAGVKDLSVWCFHCDDYLDSLRIPALSRIFDLLHQEKFGEEVSGLFSMVGGSGSYDWSYDEEFPAFCGCQSITSHLENQQGIGAINVWRICLWSISSIGSRSSKAVTSIPKFEGCLTNAAR